MVIVKLDISNAFGSLCARLVLDVLSGKASPDYACGIKVDEEFETSVHGDYKVIHRNSWFFAMLPFTFGGVFLKCSLTFVVWPSLMMVI